MLALENEEMNLPQEAYLKHSSTIKGIKFTHRELDIIAFIISGRSSKKIAALLSISPRTVENHIRNIMVKLECNSRECIIDFIEKSGEFLALKKHYSSLSIQVVFKQSLRETFLLASKKACVCLIICDQEREKKSLFNYYLEKYLKLAGLKISIVSRENYTSLTHLNNARDLNQFDHIIYTEPTRIKTHNMDLEISEFIQKASPNLKSIIFLLTQPSENVNIFQKFQKVAYVNFSEQKNYYFSFFEILKMVLQNVNLDQIIANFKNQYQIISDSPDKSFSSTRLGLHEPFQKDPTKLLFASILKKAKLWGFLGGLLCLNAIGILAFTFYGSKPDKLIQLNEDHFHQLPAVRSDFVIPVAFLNRPELLAQMKDKLKGTHGIKTLALAGIGGAGKTTIARQYARSQKMPVVWEVNAETKESLISSFENLAYTLSKTDAEKKTLRGLRDIKNFQEREEKIILFVKERLKSYQNWLLIYDNVGKFTDIQKYFPYDPLVWGKGRIIITTRDKNIETNGYINDTVQIGELSHREKLALFNKILYNNQKSQSIAASQEQSKNFLKNIPPFPLDISAAAYYLKATNISFERYLDHLRHYNKDFEFTQENILREASDYTKTRYSIVTLSLKKLIDTHKDFKDLLLFISLLDSQNIPKTILDSYKNEVVVDNFLYHLNKYSLITHQSSKFSIPKFSIHRSTQELSLAYLKKLLSLEKNSNFLLLLAHTLESYIADAIDKEDFLKMKLLVTHCETFLSHHDVLGDKITGPVNGALGCIYYYLSHNIKAKQHLEDSLVHLNNSRGDDQDRIARFLMYLGNVYRALGHYKKAKNLLEKSLLIYKRQPKTILGAARVLGYLGVVYRGLGDYKKAQNLLEQSLEIYSTHCENHVGHAWILAHLGNTYMILGDYKRSQYLLEQSLRIYKKHSEDYVGVSWVLGYLGDVYKSLGNYKKSKNLIEQSLVICRKHFPESHPYVASSEAYLGDVYRKLGDFEKAKNLLEKSLVIYEKCYGKDSVETARVLRTLGQVYLSEGYLTRAEHFIYRALRIFQKNKYSESYISLEDLAELYLIKSIKAQKNGLKIQSKKFKTQAIDYSKEALKIVKYHFPTDSRHIIRIQKRLKSLSA